MYFEKYRLVLGTKSRVQDGFSRTYTNWEKITGDDRTHEHNGGKAWSKVAQL